MIKKKKKKIMNHTRNTFAVSESEQKQQNYHLIA